MSFIVCARRVYLCAPRRWRTIGREQGGRRWGELPLTRGAADDAQRRRWGERATATH